MSHKKRPLVTAVDHAVTIVTQLRYTQVLKTTAYILRIHKNYMSLLSFTNTQVQSASAKLEY